MADKAYTTLGLQRGATAEDIEEAYQRLLTECNTPCGKNAQAIARSSELREAYEELMLLTDDESGKYSPKLKMIKLIFICNLTTFR